MKMDLISRILRESEAYSSYELIEAHIQDEKSLENLPLQPLYLALKQLEPKMVAQALVRLGREQREAFCNIDLWHKDHVDPEQFNYWIQTYSNCDDDSIRHEFVRSQQFQLFLKAKFNIWTFDTEDPQYPDHDNYFLTEDSLLLFEYEENYEFVDQVQVLIRDLYSILGVENAYTCLFKLVSDSYSLLQEEEYRFKKNQLEDFGFVDYYDALEILSQFPSRGHIDVFISKKTKTTSTIDTVGKLQSLHNQSVIAYKDKVDLFSEELNKVEDEKRSDYLHFNFVKIVNASLSLNDALRDGSVAMTRVGKETKSNMLLGFNYIKYLAENDERFKEMGSEPIFERFDFVDFYKVGKSLIGLLQKKVKKNLNEFKNDSDEAFLGEYWNKFFDIFLAQPAEYFVDIDGTKKARLVETYNDYMNVEMLVELYSKMHPLIKKFLTEFKELKTEGKLQDDFYLNYDVVEIDFEAILLSSLCNSILKNPSQSLKLGLTIPELKKVLESYFSTEGEFQQGDELNQELVSYLASYGLDSLGINEELCQYMRELFVNHLSGYDLSQITDEEFKHVGGPILLNIGKS